MRSLFCFLLLLGLASSEWTSEESTEIEGKDVKPWLRQAPSLRLRHRSDNLKKENKSSDELEKELLDGLEEDDQKEYFLVKTYNSLSLAQKKERYLRWAEKVNREKEMGRFLKRQDQWRRTENKDLEAVAEEVEDKIKEVLEVVREENIPVDEQKEQISEIVKDSSKPVIRVLRSLFPEYTRRHLQFRGKYPQTEGNNSQGHPASQYPYNWGVAYTRHRRTVEDGDN